MKNRWWKCLKTDVLTLNSFLIQKSFSMEKKFQANSQEKKVQEQKGSTHLICLVGSETKFSNSERKIMKSQ